MQDDRVLSIIHVLARWYRADITAVAAEEELAPLGVTNLHFQANAVSFAFDGYTWRIKHTELRDVRA